MHSLRLKEIYFSYLILCISFHLTLKSNFKKSKKEKKMRREEKFKSGTRWWMCVMLHLERIAMVGMSEEYTDVCWPLVHHLPQRFLQSFFYFFGEDLWRWPSVNCIKMNQPFWVFFGSSDYLLPVCLPHHSTQQFVTHDVIKVGDWKIFMKERLWKAGQSVV